MPRARPPSPRGPTIPRFPAIALIDIPRIPRIVSNHAAGVGLTAGQFIDENLDGLIELLMAAENCIAADKKRGAADAIVKFAELVFQISPFHPPKVLPLKWRDALHAWVLDTPSSDVIQICGDDEGVDFIQEALTYRLPWAMEAVRVHALAVGREDAETLTGTAALAAESGSANVSAITLIRAGLSSREAAVAAITSTGATFANRPEMTDWLRSTEVRRLASDDEWPTARSRHAWVQFYEAERAATEQKWHREVISTPVNWKAAPPKEGAHVVVEGLGAHGAVLSPDFRPLGQLLGKAGGARRDIVGARVGVRGETIALEFFRPKPAK